MKNLIKAYFSAVTVNNLLMAVFLYVLFFPPSTDDFLLVDIGLGDMIVGLILFTFLQLIFLPLIGWPFFVIVTKKRRFSPLSCILLGLIIAASYSIIVMVIKGNFDMVEFIGFLLFGLFSGLVLAVFYSLFNRQAKSSSQTAT